MCLRIGPPTPKSDGATCDDWSMLSVLGRHRHGLPGSKTTTWCGNDSDAGRGIRTVRISPPGTVMLMRSMIVTACERDGAPAIFTSACPGPAARLASYMFPGRRADKRGHQCEPKRRK